jgi:hypothetical protein
VPVVAERIENRMGRTAKKGCRSHITGVLPHLLVSQELVQFMDRGYMDVVNDQDATRAYMGIDEIILNLGEWKCVRSIDERKLVDLGRK